MNQPAKSPLFELRHKSCTCPTCGAKHRTPENQRAFARRADHCAECSKVCGDVYKVHDTVWAAAKMQPFDGVLHLLCLETRIGRKLRASDFTQSAINGALHFGLRLVERAP